MWGNNAVLFPGVHAGACLFALGLKPSPDSRSCSCWHGAVKTAACADTRVSGKSPFIVNDGWADQHVFASVCGFLYRSLKYAHWSNPNIFLTPVEDTEVIVHFRPDGTAEHGCTESLIETDISVPSWQTAWETPGLNANGIRLFKNILQFSLCVCLSLAAFLKVVSLDEG